MAVAHSYAQLKSALWAAPGAKVHAVIDGLVVPDLPTRLHTAAVLGWDCIQRGALTSERAQQVPYIAELEAASPFTDWLLVEASSAYPGWGVVSISNGALLPMREHFRSIGDVLMPEGDRRVWRWYDPEVLATILPSLLASQLDEFFGAGQTLVVPAPRCWTWHALERGVLASTTRDLTSAAG